MTIRREPNDRPPPGGKDSAGTAVCTYLGRSVPTPIPRATPPLRPPVRCSCCGRRPRGSTPMARLTPSPTYSRRPPKQR